jgi:hypothetical protein
MAPTSNGRRRMAAYETHSASQAHPGTRHPPNQQALSSLPILSRRLPASSSFVLARALAGRPGLWALQLDPDRAPTQTPAAASKSTTTGTTPHPAPAEVTGLDQYALLTKPPPMGAGFS